MLRDERRLYTHFCFMGVFFFAEVVRVIESVTELDAVFDEHFTSPASSFSYSRMSTTPSSSSVSSLSSTPPYSPPTCVPPPPASLSCCTEFGTVLCLFEDGSTTTRSSKRLQEAKYTNRTYRARFPEPVAFLLSLASRRGKTQKSVLGKRNTSLACEKVNTEGKPENNCPTVSTGEHPEGEGQSQLGNFQWLHILLPCNARRFGFQDKTNDCERTERETSITSASSLTERVWEELRSITHVGGRCLKSGGPLFCFSSQDTLRPLLQRFPQNGRVSLENTIESLSLRTTERSSLPAPMISFQSVIATSNCTRTLCSFMY